MNDREDFFVNNYPVFGSGISNRCGYTKKEIKSLKDKYKEKGEYMLPIREINQYPMQEGNQEGKYSSIGFAIACLDQEDQQMITELAKHMPDPEVLIDEALALQSFRLALAMKNEQERGYTLETTESTMMNYVNIIQAKKNICDGQEVNFNVNNTITSLLDEFDDDDIDEVIEIDIDKEKKKEELKEIREQDFQDLINDI